MQRTTLPPLVVVAAAAATLAVAAVVRAPAQGPAPAVAVARHTVCSQAPFSRREFGQDTGESSSRSRAWMIARESRIEERTATRPDRNAHLVCALRHGHGPQAGDDLLEVVTHDVETSDVLALIPIQHAHRQSMVVPRGDIDNLTVVMMTVGSLDPLE